MWLFLRLLNAPLHHSQLHRCSKTQTQLNASNVLSVDIEKRLSTQIAGLSLRLEELEKDGVEKNAEELATLKLQLADTNAKLEDAKKGEQERNSKELKDIGLEINAGRPRAGQDSVFRPPEPLQESQQSSHSFSSHRTF